MDAAQKDENETFHDADHEEIAYEKEVAENEIAVVEDRGFSPYVILLVLLILIFLYGISQFGSSINF